jgi:anti-sigma-K factor RskA
MVLSDDDIALAAEYALGTLDAEERAQVEAKMAADKAFSEMVTAWEYRLGSLNQMVGAVEPRPVVWDNIKAAIRPEGEAPVALTPPDTPPVAPASEDAPIRQVPIVDDSNIIDLSRAVRRWRNVASVAGAIAAVLVVMLALQASQPDWLPEGLRPKPRTQTAVRTSAPAAAPSGRYVAVLQQDPGAPGFILTVDTATKNFTVRRVGAAPEPGKSFELWLISDRLPQPRSLGVIGTGEFTTRPALSGDNANLVDGATYAVTVEPAGGSPTGQPSSAPVFSGKLIEVVPSEAAPPH